MEGVSYGNFFSEKWMDKRKGELGYFFLKFKNKIQKKNKYFFFAESELHKKTHIFSKNP